MSNHQAAAPIYAVPPAGPVDLAEFHPTPADPGRLIPGKLWGSTGEAQAASLPYASIPDG